MIKKGSILGLFLPSLATTRLNSRLDITTSEKEGELGVFTNRQKWPFFDPLFYHFFCLFLPFLASTRLNSRLAFSTLKSSGDGFWTLKWHFFVSKLKKARFLRFFSKWKSSFLRFFIFWKVTGAIAPEKWRFWKWSFFDSFKNDPKIDFFNSNAEKYGKIFGFFWKHVIFRHFFVTFFTFFVIFGRFSALTTNRTQKWPLKMTLFWPLFDPFLSLFFRNYLVFGFSFGKFNFCSVFWNGTFLSLFCRFYHFF